MATSESGQGRSAAEAELSTLRAEISARLDHPDLLPAEWAGALQELLRTIDSTPVASLSDEALAPLVREAGKAVELTGRYAPFLSEVDQAVEQPRVTLRRSEELARKLPSIEGPGWSIGGPGGLSV